MGGVFRSASSSIFFPFLDVQRFNIDFCASSRGYFFWRVERVIECLEFKYSIISNACMIPNSLTKQASRMLLLHSSTPWGHLIPYVEFDDIFALPEKYNRRSIEIIISSSFTILSSVVRIKRWVSGLRLSRNNSTTTIPQLLTGSALPRIRWPTESFLLLAALNSSIYTLVVYRHAHIICSSDSNEAYHKTKEIKTNVHEQDKTKRGGRKKGTEVNYPRQIYSR